VPKTLSLKRKKDFQRLFKSGIRKSSKYFSIVFTDSEYIKFAFIVDAKTMPKANHRVYSKRIMREVVRKDFLANLEKKLFIGIRPLKDLKLIVKEIGFESIRLDLLNLLMQIDQTRAAVRR
jgi:ribonuclease P protein component